MTEEVKNARRQAPRAIVLAVYIGFFTGFIFLIAACFCMGDLDATAGTPTGVPIIEIFRHSTGSNAGATGLASLILMVGLGASNALTTTGGRSIYAFARDRGLPFSNWLSRVNPGNATPINGLCAAVFVQFVLLAIYFGAVQGFVTVISIATEGFCTSIPSRPSSPVPFYISFPSQAQADKSSHTRRLLRPPPRCPPPIPLHIDAPHAHRQPLQSRPLLDPAERHRPGLSRLHVRDLQFPVGRARRRAEHELYVCGRRRDYVHCADYVAHDGAEAVYGTEEWGCGVGEGWGC